MLPILGISLGVFGLFAPVMFILATSILLLICFFLLIGLRTWLYLLGAHQQRTRGRNLEPVIKRPDCNWPTYTVLVPLYNEAGSVPGLVSALNRIDYPADKLEILFLTEQADEQTRMALAREPLHMGAQILTLPNGQPRTKPRALNVALARLSGEFVTIYDAEDRPHPGQLKSAVEALEKGGPGLACVQAPLYAYNSGGSWLAGQWALEYDVHFGLILPALARLGLPIALGGTSNHFRVSALRCAGGWDAWNVTEDADIGLRFARMGLSVDVIAAPTQEEAPETLSIWIRQRSRWIKGYMQTWIVLMRQPLRAAHEMGWKNFLASYWLLSGAIGSALLHLPCLVWLLICALSPEAALAPIGAAILIAGYLASAVSVFLAPGGMSSQRLGLVASFWLYWPLLSLAAAIAFFELLWTPHSWAKTPHALTRYTPRIDQEAFA
jgi:cellulose synthase/poly-beta-1,6-N-acetylglucosamine synthase-like glycosyltransferase